MNIGNILKVADAIEQASVPGLGFNMSKFCGDATDEIPDNSGHSCGTVACIAGHARAIRTSCIDPVSVWEYNSTQDARWLGLSDADAEVLFFTDGSPSFDLYTIKPAEAVRCLRNLAITGKVDWTAAMKPDDPAMPALPVKASQSRKPIGAS